MEFTEYYTRRNALEAKLSRQLDDIFGHISMGLAYGFSNTIFTKLMCYERFKETLKLNDCIVHELQCELDKLEEKYNEEKEGKENESKIEEN